MNKNDKDSRQWGGIGSTGQQVDAICLCILLYGGVKTLEHESATYDTSYTYFTILVSPIMFFPNNYTTYFWAAQILYFTKDYEGTAIFSSATIQGTPFQICIYICMYMSEFWACNVCLLFSGKEWM